MTERKGRPARTIALDGPVASGKSVVGRAVARRLGYRYLDTGLMYRAVALLARRRGIPPEDAPALERLARSLRFRLEGDRLRVDGEDLTDALAEPSLGEMASRVAVHPGVRSALVSAQRALAEEGPVVMAGRDIGTVVLPDADLKVFLTASPEERARRRWRELRARGEEAGLEEVLREVEERDRRDATRPVAPLRPAPDAVVLETDGLPLEEVVRRVVALAGGE